MSESTQYVRPNWDEYFLEIGRSVAKRSTFDRGRVSAILVRENQILVTGYAGAPKGLPHCDDVGHQIKKTIHEDGHESEHCVRTIHAEQNALVQAAKVGISVAGATLYCKMTPCATCAKLLIGVGIKRIVCEKRYHAGEESEQMFREVGVELNFIDEEVEKYIQK
jgi:dCMP deaminase